MRRIFTFSRMFPGKGKDLCPPWSIHFDRICQNMFSIQLFLRISTKDINCIMFNWRHSVWPILTPKCSPSNTWHIIFSPLVTCWKDVSLQKREIYRLKLGQAPSDRIHTRRLACVSPSLLITIIKATACLVLPGVSHHVSF